MRKIALGKWAAGAAVNYCCITNIMDFFAGFSGRKIGVVRSEASGIIQKPNLALPAVDIFQSCRCDKK